GRPDITTSRVGISTPNSTPISDPEVEDIEPADDPVDGVEDAALVDQDVVELDGPGRRLARPRRHERRDLLRLERIPDVEGAHAAVEEGADDDVLRDPAARAVLVQVVAPKRPPRPANFFTGGSGHVLIGTSLSSRCASTIHTSLGQSLAASRTDSSLTTSRFLSNKGTTVWQKPGKGG